MKETELKKLVKAIIKEVISLKNESQEQVIYKDRQGGETVYWMDNKDTGGHIYLKPEAVARMVKKGHKIIELDADPRMAKRQIDPDLSNYTDLEELGLSEAGEIQLDRISPREKKLMSQAFNKVGLDGNGRFQSVSQGLRAVTDALSSLGFNLDMVTGDMVLGEKGQRQLSFRRTNDPGADPFTEKPMIKNSRIAFVWENLSGEGATPRYEILAYPS